MRHPLNTFSWFAKQRRTTRLHGYNVRWLSLITMMLQIIPQIANCFLICWKFISCLKFVEMRIRYWQNLPRDFNLMKKISLLIPMIWCRWTNCYKFNNTDTITRNTCRYSLSLSSHDLLMGLLMDLLFKLQAISKVICITITRHSLYAYVSNICIK